MRNTTLLGNAIKICNSANKQFIDIESVKNDIIDAGIASGLSKTQQEESNVYPKDFKDKKGKRLYRYLIDRI